MADHRTKCRCARCRRQRTKDAESYCGVGGCPNTASWTKRGFRVCDNHYQDKDRRKQPGGGRRPVTGGTSSRGTSYWRYRGPERGSAEAFYSWLARQRGRGDLVGHLAKALAGSQDPYAAIKRYQRHPMGEAAYAAALAEWRGYQNGGRG